MTTESTGFALVPYDDGATASNAPITIAVGHLGSRVYFDADPEDGTIGITADEAELTFDIPEFALMAELLIRVAMAD